MKNKISNLIPLFIFFFLISSLIFTINAQNFDTTGSGVGDNAAAGYVNSCDDPFSAEYTTQRCVKARLGIQDLKTNEILVARDPNTIFVVAAQIVLWIAVVVSVFRIAWKGIQIGGAGDDADKRKEFFVAIIWTLVGLVVALGALGLTNFVASLIFGDKLNDRIVDCTQIPANASQDLIQKCNNVVGGSTVTPTP